MRKITRNLEVWGTEGKVRIENVLFDSGASMSVIREDIARMIGRVKDFGGKAKKPLLLADG